MADLELDFFQVTRTDAGTAARTLTLQLKGFGTSGDDTNAEGIEAAEFAQPLGLAARPSITSGTEAIAVRRGDEVLALLVLDKSGPALAVEEGGVQLYGPKEPTATVYIRANGDVQVTSKSGRDVVFQGGSTPVAVEGSRTAGHQHAQGTYVAGPYPVTGLSASQTDTVATGQGAQHVKAPAAGT